jgi:osmotically-inducible protein OsmY
MNPIGPDSWPRSSAGVDWVAQEVMDAELFLAALIVDGIRQDPGVPAGDLWVEVQNGVVILRGTLHSAEAHEAALRRARGIPGVFDVCDMLTIAAE